MGTALVPSAAPSPFPESRRKSLEMPRVINAFVAATSMAAVALSGCGGSVKERTDLAGKATFSGKPIVYGQIDFLPDGAKGHKGPSGGAEILNGEFDTAKTGAGILPGPHRVQITAYEAKPANNMDETSVTKSTPLFIGYEVTAELTSAPYEVDVPATAKGFDAFKSSQQNRPAANAP